MENILDHVASFLKKDPLEVRQVNLITPGVPRLFQPHENTPIKDKILPLLLQKANYTQRKAEVDQFNKVSSNVFIDWYKIDQIEYYFPNNMYFLTQFIFYTAFLRQTGGRNVVLQ